MPRVTTLLPARDNESFRRAGVASKSAVLMNLLREFKTSAGQGVRSPSYQMLFGSSRQPFDRRLTAESCATIESVLAVCKHDWQTGACVSRCHARVVLTEATRHIGRHSRIERAISAPQDIDRPSRIAGRSVIAPHALHSIIDEFHRQGFHDSIREPRRPFIGRNRIVALPSTSSSPPPPQ
jgi:hypothetical protein